MTGTRPVNRAAFAIHSEVHAARPDVVAAAHAHSVHGKGWSALGRLLDPITQDVCAFYQDHSLFDDYRGVVQDLDEGKRIVRTSLQVTRQSFFATTGFSPLEVRRGGRVVVHCNGSIMSRRVAGPSGRTICTD
jgi:hypothetical protein